MKASRALPAVDRAHDFVRNQLADNVWRTGEYLPSISDLARAAGVSRTSMIKAVALLREQGLVSGGKRQRTRAGVADQPAPPSLEGARQRWQEKRLSFERDLFSGVFGRQENLPTVKELQARYGVSFATMKKIIGAMVADGVLRPAKNGYAPATRRFRRFRQRAVFVTPAASDLQISALNPEQNRVVNLFENECARAGLDLEVVRVDYYDSSARHALLSGLAADDTILGFVLDVWWFDTPQVQTSTLDMLARLTQFKKPVAILDENGNFELPVNLCANPLIQVYSIEGRRAGESVARYLLNQGHRSVAYISMVHESPWSQERFEGIAAQFARAGAGEGVHLLSDTLGEGVPLMLAASGLSEDEIQRCISVGRTPSQVRDLRERWEAAKKGPPRRIDENPESERELRHILAGMRVVLQHGFDDDAVACICNEIFTVVRHRMVTYRSMPLFEKALELKGVRAWICASDWIALEALTFLEGRKIGIPSEIAVVGFDNMPLKALDRGLTTYDFNAMGFVHQILSFLTRPPRPRGRHRHARTEVEGMLMARKSTRRR